MKRLLVIVAGAMFLAAAAGAHPLAQETQDAKAKQEKSAAAKTLRAAGEVTAVTGTSLTVKTAAGEATYAIDEKTKVISRGGSTKSKQAKEAGKKTTIVDFVATGDRVEVTYHEMGTTKHAASVRVTRKAT